MNEKGAEREQTIREPQNVFLQTARGGVAPCPH